MRAALKKLGLPEDLYVCAEKPSIPLAQELMAICDLTIATGGPAMAKSAHQSGKPAYAAGQGNSTMVIDETADIEEAARNSRLSKMSDFGSGCSADGNLIVEASIYDRFLDQLQTEGGYLANEEQKAKLEAVLWVEGHRTIDTIACPAAKLAEKAGFSIPEDKKFIIVQQDKIGKEHAFSGEKLTTLLAVFKYSGFDNALEMVRQIYNVQGRGHSCGIYSFDDEHIHQLALTAPVSRMMVRQPQSKANAGAFNNGMPMTSSMGCGVWAGNITNENINLKHYLNYTWVARPIPEDRPSEEELFGEFYNTETLENATHPGPDLSRRIAPRVRAFLLPEEAGSIFPVFVETRSKLIPYKGRSLVFCEKPYGVDCPDQSTMCSSLFHPYACQENEELLLLI
jgi:sulfoacetaldehyde dehydrogenase